MHLPVVVFSSSGVAADAQRSLQAGASSYLTKPAGLNAFTEAVQSTLRLWRTRLDIPDS